MVRVLVDATAVPADRGGVGRYVDGLVAALGAARCRSRGRLPALRRRALRPAGTRRHDRPGPGRDRPPPRPAGLGADRPAAGRPAGRARGPALAALHDAAAGRPAGRRHDARRDLLHRARGAHRGQGHRSSGPRPGRRCAGRPAASCRRKATRDELIRVARRRPDPARRRLPRRRPRDVPRAAATPSRHRVHGPASACAAEPYVAFLGHARAAQERPGADPRLGRRRSRDRRDPPALVLAGGRGWDDDDRRGGRRGAAPPAGAAARATCRSQDLPGFLGGALVVAYPSLGEGFGLPVLEAMACGAPVLTTPRLSLPEVGGDAVAYTEPDADVDRDRAEPRCSTTPSGGPSSAAAGHAAGARSSPGRPAPRRTSRPTRAPLVSDRTAGDVRLRQRRRSTAGRRASPTRPGDTWTRSSTRSATATTAPYEVVLADNGSTDGVAGDGGADRPRGRVGAAPAATSATAGRPTRRRRGHDRGLAVVANPDIIWHARLARRAARRGPSAGRRAARSAPDPTPRRRRSTRRPGPPVARPRHRPRAVRLVVAVATRGPRPTATSRAQPARADRRLAVRLVPAAAPRRLRAGRRLRHRATSCTSRTSTSATGSADAGWQNVYVPDAVVTPRRAATPPSRDPAADGTGAPSQRLAAT